MRCNKGEIITLIKQGAPFSPGPTGQQIEATRQMIQAGLEVLEYGREALPEQELVSRIYSAMRRLESGQECVAYMTKG